MSKERDLLIYIMDSICEINNINDYTFNDYDIYIKRDEDDNIIKEESKLIIKMECPNNYNIQKNDYEIITDNYFTNIILNYQFMDRFKMKFDKL